MSDPSPRTAFSTCSNICRDQHDFITLLEVQWARDSKIKNWFYCNLVLLSRLLKVQLTEVFNIHCFYF